jgi:hypothetical protein
MAGNTHVEKGGNLHQGGPEPAGASTKRVRRFRARRREKRVEAERSAKIARRAELDLKRAAKGLPPALNSTERARLCRQRRAARERIKAESKWYSPALSFEKAKAFARSLDPTAHDKDLAVKVELAERGCFRYQLPLNRFVIQNGVEAARMARLVLYHCEGDETLTETHVLDLPENPLQRRQYLELRLIASQACWRDGKALREGLN